MAVEISGEPWAAVGEHKSQAVRSMFAEIAGSYDLVNSVMSGRRHHAWRTRAVQALKLSQGDRALDVCCGTGDFLRPLAKAVGQSGLVLGLDFCGPMLAVAGKKERHARLLLADATWLPVVSQSFDAVTIGWGLRNVPDRPTTLSECARSLKPGGRIAVLDMTPATNFVSRVADKVFHSFVPLLGALLGHGKAYRYLPKSTERFPAAEQIADELRVAGFQSVKVERMCFGLVALHLGSKP